MFSCSVHRIEAIIFIQKFDPLPSAEIQLWEDYTFMLVWEQIWSAAEMTNKQQSNSTRDILSTASPLLIKILYAHRVFPDTRGRRILSRIHVVLDLPWCELRTALSPLIEILDRDMARLDELLSSNLDETFFGRVDLKSLLLELAEGCLHVIGEYGGDGRADIPL